MKGFHIPHDMTQYVGKIYPNGEFSVYRPKRFTPEGVKVRHISKKEQALKDFVELNKALGGRGLIDVYEGAEKLGWPSDLGLSLHRNFDREPEPIRYGLKGIPSKAARKVRNGAYLLQKEYEKKHLSFLTVTMPDLDRVTMKKVHSKWATLVDGFKRRLTRLLKSRGLDGEVVMVVEVQEERYERTGIPVLHIHAVFQGRKRFSSWAIKTTEFDAIWKTSLEDVSETKVDVKAACNVQRVKASAEGYMGKYMTKGCKTVKAIVEAGLEEWLPRQWWSMSRSLSQRIESQTVRLKDDAIFLWNACTDDDSPILLFSRGVVLVNKMGIEYICSFYGRVHPAVYQFLS